HDAEEGYTLLGVTPAGDRALVITNGFPVGPQVRWVFETGATRVVTDVVPDDHLGSDFESMVPYARELKDAPLTRLAPFTKEIRLVTPPEPSVVSPDHRFIVRASASKGRRVFHDKTPDSIQPDRYEWMLSF